MVGVLVLALAMPYLTPGEIRPLDTHAVCSIRWNADRRHVTRQMKRIVAARYGIRWADRGRYEFDHKIPRELAGSDSVGNLWPQPIAEARIKDRLENALHREVCRGRLALADAQARMRRWGQD